jgi:heat shock protein HslJ
MPAKAASSAKAILFALTVLAPPCAHAASALDGTEWQLEDLAGQSVLADAQATLAFAADGKISGKGSCNRFFGTATLADGRISIGPLGATRMACAPAVDEQEIRYLQALGAAERFTLEGPYLRIFCRGFNKPLRFIRATPR